MSLYIIARVNISVSMMPVLHEVRIQELFECYLRKSLAYRFFFIQHCSVDVQTFLTSGETIVLHVNFVYLNCGNLQR